MILVFGRSLAPATGESHRRMQLLKSLLPVSLLLLGGVVLPGQEKKEPAADNTAVNKRDRTPDAVTADQQKMNKADQELTRKIRRAVVKESSLSTYARNVKIIARDGMVTVKGPVRSTHEKELIVSKAKEIAGAGNVTDELTIAAAKPE